MTDRTDVARARDIVARWSALAEQRLEYLTELYETGRWRRYHSEREFLENIREAKGAVETWRGLLNDEATPDNRPVDISWLGRGSSVRLPKREVPTEQAPAIAPSMLEAPQVTEAAQVIEASQATEVQPVSVVPDIAEPEAVMAEPVMAEPVMAEAEPEPVLALEEIQMPEESSLEETLALTLDIVAMAERYPLLRNAFQGNG